MPHLRPQDLIQNEKRLTLAKADLRTPVVKLVSPLIANLKNKIILLDTKKLFLRTRRILHQTYYKLCKYTILSHLPQWGRIQI